MTDRYLKALRTLLIATGVYVLALRLIVGRSTAAAYSFLNSFLPAAYFIYLGLTLICLIAAALMKFKTPKAYTLYYFGPLIITIMAWPSLNSYFDPAYTAGLDYNMEFLLSFGQYGDNFYTTAFFFTLLYYAMNLSVVMGILALLFLKPEKNLSKRSKKAAVISQTPRKKQPVQSKISIFKNQTEEDPFRPDAARPTVSYSDKVDTSRQIDIFDQDDHFFTRHTKNDIF